MQCAEAEEHPTILFCQDVTKYAIDRRVKAVRDVLLTVAKDPLDFLKVFRNFCEQVYTEADVDGGLQQSLLDNIDKSLSKEQNDEVGAPFDC